MAQGWTEFHLHRTAAKKKPDRLCGRTLRSRGFFEGFASGTQRIKDLSRSGVHGCDLVGADASGKHQIWRKQRTYVGRGSMAGKGQQATLANNQNDLN